MASGHMGDPGQGWGKSFAVSQDMPCTLPSFILTSAACLLLLATWPSSFLTPFIAGPSATPLTHKFSTPSTCPQQEHA